VAVTQKSLAADLLNRAHRRQRLLQRTELPTNSVQTIPEQHLLYASAFPKHDQATPPRKKPTKATLPSFEEFHTRFVRVLKNHYTAEPLIPDIVKDEVLGMRCADLLWLCVNDSFTRLAEISKKWCTHWDSAFNTAIRGTEIMAEIYTTFDRKPHHVEYINNLRRDLLEKQRKLTALRPKSLGRDRDWSSVLFAKDNLESLLGSPLPGATLAALLNAAYKATGRETKDLTVDAIGMALTRLNRRRS
jgi:hypothetical protein